MVLGGMDFVERGRWPHPSAQGFMARVTAPHIHTSSSPFALVRPLLFIPIDLGSSTESTYSVGSRAGPPEIRRHLNPLVSYAAILLIYLWILFVVP